ncbi:MAG: redoxin domain-containing protein [Cellvibrionaceae bacterium]
MKHISILFALLVCALPSFAVQPGDKVDNFKLLDHEGRINELYYLSDAKAVVVMIHGNGCPIARNAVHGYKALRDKYKAQGVEFLMLNANLQDNRASIAKEAEEFGIDIPILIDDTQIIAESLAVERTADVFVIKTDDWKVAYRGSLNDRLGYETQRNEATENYVADALDAVLKGEQPALATTEAQGCLVNLPELDRREEHKLISYADDVAPILINKCLTCHRDGGIGPFAMSEYNMIRGFAPMIREVVRTKRMPPWHADPHVGTFSNDRSLSAEEVQTLVHWVEAGAPRGKGEDPLANYKHNWPEWTLGEPDVIVEIPTFNIPATGVIDYMNPTAENPLDEDVWVRAVEILPGSRKSLHHVITTFGKPNPKARGGIDTLGGLGGYVPGAIGEQFPEGTGVFLPKDAVFSFQMHYTTYGKADVDTSRMGIYLHKEKPKYPLDSMVLLNPMIKIPPNTKEYWATRSSKPLERDIMVYTLLPHAHFRGKAMNFIAKYPDGRKETLLSVPNYDFNWQTTYHLEAPKVLPAGTVIEHNASWDNSAQNPANPDPNREVPWGLQSWDEMLFGSIKWRYLNPQEGDASAGLGIVEREDPES